MDKQMNKNENYAGFTVGLLALLLILTPFVAGFGKVDPPAVHKALGGGGAGQAVVPGPAGGPGAAAHNPTVTASNPTNGVPNVPTSTNSWNGSINVLTGTLLTATFSEAMDPTTLNSNPAGTLLTFTLKKKVGGTNVPGTVAMSSGNTVATFTPTSALLPNTQYTATVTTAAKTALGVKLTSAVAWSFTTNAVAVTRQAPVNLGLAGNYAIFTDTGITNATTCPTPCITGDMGVGPGVTSTAITGFALVLGAGSPFSTSAQVTGKVYAFDYAAPTPTNVTTASTDMLAAYNDAAGRTAGVGASNLNLGGGTLTTRTLAPGVYTWGTAVNIPAAQILTLSGGPNDVWIFQIADTLTVAATASVNLAGGALPKNVFWQVAGTSATVGASPAHFEGVILAKFAINFGNQASANSRLLAQTAVNLDRTTVTQPAP